VSIKLAVLTIAGVTLSTAARADFSYTETMKGGANTTTKHYLKGQKMKIETADGGTVMDFDAQTVTSYKSKDQTYSVTKFADLGLNRAGVEVKADVKETGERKVVSGLNCKEVVLNMEIDGPAQGAAAGMKMQAEIDIWYSPDVPGSRELHSFYQKNSSRFPWSALGGQNSNMQKAMVDLQRKMTEVDGVPVLETVKIKPATGGAGMPTLTPAQQAQMAQMRVQMEAMAKQGGPQGAAAQQALARMGAMPGAGSGGSLMEIQMESSGFSTGDVSDSIFSIPSGYKKVDDK
jgi:hypothetical protein